MWGIIWRSSSRVAVISFPESQQSSCLAHWGAEALSILCWSPSQIISVGCRALVPGSWLWIRASGVHSSNGPPLTPFQSVSECFRVLKATNWSWYWSGPSVIFRLIINMKYFPVHCIFSKMKLYFENVSYKLHHNILGGVKCGLSTADSN